MGKGKRSRKIRSAHRRERRADVYRKALLKAVAYRHIAREATQALGFVVDPIGQLNEEMRRIVEEKNR